jgi:hypothetical protein
MLYARIDLSQTNYSTIPNHKRLEERNIAELDNIYTQYCKHKRFKSVMPIFDTEYLSYDLIGYYDNNELVAFSLLRCYDTDNVEAIQFAWDYRNPKLRLGIESLKNECALYKQKGYKYLYLGGADE